MLKKFTIKFTALAVLFFNSCSLNSNFYVSEAINIKSSNENIKIVYKEVQEVISNLDIQPIIGKILDKYPYANTNNILAIKMKTSMIKENFSSTINTKRTIVENSFVTIEMEMNYDKSKSEEAHQVIKLYKIKIIEALKLKGISL